MKLQVGKNLREMRDRRGLSREALARAANVSAAAIVQIESGIRWPRPENIVSIAQALEVSPWYFFQGEDENSTEESLKKIAMSLGFSIKIEKRKLTK